MAYMKFVTGLKFAVVVAFLYYCLVNMRLMVRNFKSESHTTIHPVPAPNLGAPGAPGRGCPTAVFGAVVLSAQDRRDFELQVKSILVVRTTPVLFYVISDRLGGEVIKTLFSTWSLPNVTLHTEPSDVSARSKSSDRFRTFLLHIHRAKLKKDQDLIFYMLPQMVVVGELPRLFENGDVAIKAPLFMSSLLDDGNIKLDLWNVLVLSHRGLLHAGLLNKIEACVDAVCLHSLLKPHTQPLPCQYNVVLGSNRRCTHTPQVIRLPPARFSADAVTESLRERVAQLRALDGHVFTLTRGRCVRAEPPQPLPAEPCSEFKTVARLTRRTHPYYYGDGPLTSTDDHDVTLVTQFTVDRFSVFERMCTQWRGPLVGVVYGSEEDIVTLLDLLARSSVRRRKHIALHVVYKRGPFYPINYIRNVGLRHVTSQYCLFVDVDLVPNADLYSQVKDALRKENNRTTAFVVAAFDTFVNLPVFPQNKSMLLPLLRNKTVTGYKMWRGWNLGHKPTNYPKFMVSSVPYKVDYADAFEPYVVMQTRDLPRYDERLLERMADKIVYGLHLYKLGVTFKVLPASYVLHLPHPESKGTQQWRRYPGYARCGGVIVKEIKRDLNERVHVMTVSDRNLNL